MRIQEEKLKLGVLKENPQMNSFNAAVEVLKGNVYRETARIL